MQVSHVTNVSHPAKSYGYYIKQLFCQRLCKINSVTMLSRVKTQFLRVGTYKFCFEINILSNVLKKLNNGTVLVILHLNNDCSGTDIGDKFSLLRCRPEVVPHSSPAEISEPTPGYQCRPMSYQGSQFKRHNTQELTLSWSKLRY